MPRRSLQLYPHLHLLAPRFPTLSFWAAIVSRVVPVLRYDWGTLVMRGVPAAVRHLFTWDARSQLFQAPGLQIAEVMTQEDAGQDLVTRAKRGD
jgi:Xeroderma pigmentosum group B helicase damage recognition domain